MTGRGGETIGWVDIKRPLPQGGILLGLHCRTLDGRIGPGLEDQPRSTELSPHHNHQF